MSSNEFTFSVPKEEIIRNLSCDSQFMNVFDKVDMPKRHHFANSHRIDDINFVTAESWSVNEYVAKSFIF